MRPIQFLGHSSFCTTAVVHLLAYAFLHRPPLCVPCLSVIGGEKNADNSSGKQFEWRDRRRVSWRRPILLLPGSCGRAPSSGSHRDRFAAVADESCGGRARPARKGFPSRPPLSLSWGNGQLGIRPKCVEIDRGVDALTCCHDLYLRPANLSP